MNSKITLILLSLYANGVICSYYYDAAIPHVLPDGHIADTPAVAAAKAEHYVAVAHEQARIDDPYSGYRRYYLREGSYHGPQAYPVVLPSGYLADSHDVAAAKAEHYTAVAHAQARNDPYSHHGYYRYDVPYYAPQAYRVVLPSGYLTDTHDVAAAKQQHYAAAHGAKSFFYNGNY